MAGSILRGRSPKHVEPPSSDGGSEGSPMITKSSATGSDCGASVPLQVILQVGGWKREAMPTRYMGKYDEGELEPSPPRTCDPCCEGVTTDPCFADPSVPAQIHRSIFRKPNTEASAGIEPAMRVFADPSSKFHSASRESEQF